MLPAPASSITQHWKLENISREESLKKVERSTSEKLTLVVTYDPRLPKMSAVVQKHFKTLVMDPRMKKVFGEGIQVGYKRHRNISEFLCRAKLHEVGDRRNPPRAVQSGWKRCNRCLTCQHSQNKNTFRISATKKNIQIKQDIDCKTCNVLYVVECTKCSDRPQYIGKTKRSLMARGREHLSNIEKMKTEVNNRSSATKMYNHFSSNGHTSKDFLIYGIEQVFGDEFVLQTRERFHIDQAQSIWKGLNTYRT